MIREQPIVAGLEHLYGRPDAPLQVWSDGFLPRLRAMLPQATRVSLTSMSFRPRRSDFASIEGDGPELFERFLQLSDALPDDAIARLYRPPHPVTTFRTMPLSDRVPYTLSVIEALFGASDLLGLVLEPEPGLGVVAAAIMPHFGALAGRTRALSASTRGVDRARTLRHRGDGEGALAVWPALVSGRLSLAERVDTDGKRLYDLDENAPRHAGLRALNARETTLVHEAARGISNKEIAYALGLSDDRGATGAACGRCGRREERRRD